MGKTTAIEWTDHTFNPWWGCTKVAPECENCYAAAFDKRTGGDHWGPGKPRRVFGEKHWNEPVRWNRDAEAAGVRRRVFCASMADVFDAEAPPGARAQLWALIQATPHLDWQLLTKRPENILGNLPERWGRGWPNVWLGTSVGHPKSLWRIPALLTVPAAVRFVSAEPLLDRVDFAPFMWPLCASWPSPYHSPEEAKAAGAAVTYQRQMLVSASRQFIDWLIVGGESGPGSRPFDIEWARHIVTACKASGVPVFVKQFGARPVLRDRFDVSEDRFRDLDRNGWDEHHGPPWLEDRRKGGDWNEWPEDLRVREFPGGVR